MKIRTPVLLLALLFCAGCAPADPIATTPAPIRLTNPPSNTTAPTPESAPTPDLQEIALAIFEHQYIDPDGDTVETRILPPPGYMRGETDGYGAFLRGQKLLQDGSPVLLYNGEMAPYQDMHAAVLAIDVGTRDLQQCADAALRLRCEYLFSIGEYEKIAYHLTNGFLFPYEKYREGYRLQSNGNDTKLVKKAKKDESYEAFRNYLDVLFNYASTRSLFPESEQIPLEDLQIGDLFLFAGKPGHCVIVMDICQNKYGEKAILLAQSSMPAQQIHILEGREGSPWYYLDDMTFPLHIAFWDFEEEHVRRMP